MDTTNYTTGDDLAVTNPDGQVIGYGTVVGVTAQTVTVTMDDGARRRFQGANLAHLVHLADADALADAPTMTATPATDGYNPVTGADYADRAWGRTDPTGWTMCTDDDGTVIGWATMTGRVRLVDAPDTYAPNGVRTDRASRTKGVQGRRIPFAEFGDTHLCGSGIQVPAVHGTVPATYVDGIGWTGDMVTTDDGTIVMVDRGCGVMHPAEHYATVGRTRDADGNMTGGYRHDVCRWANNNNLGQRGSVRERPSMSA